MKINGLDIERFRAGIHAVKADHKQGQTTCKVRLTWQGGTENAITVRRFPAYLCDEPPNMGGGNAAPNPVEYLVGAAASCFATGFEWQLADAGIILHHLDVSASGDIDIARLFGMTDGYGGLNHLTLRVRVAADADLPILQQLAERAAATSPVLNSLRTAAQLTVEKT